MTTLSELEERFDFEALAGGNDRPWQQARYWSQRNTTIATAIRDVQAAYRALSTTTLRDGHGHTTTNRTGAA